MQILPNVLVAMQSIQRTIIEAVEDLRPLEGEALSPGGKARLARCIATLNSTWEVANDYEKALPAKASRFNED